MKNITRYFMLAILTGMQGIAGALTIADGNFDPANWTTTTIATTGGASHSVSQPATGGNPGVYRLMVHSLPGLSSIVVAHQFTGASYDPSVQGAISRLDYSEDQIEIDPPFAGAAIGAHPAVLQDGTWYYGPDLVFTNLSWQTVSLSGLTAADFSNAGVHPDFSASGSIIHFGFTRSNSNTGNSSTVTTSGIDNWSFVVTTASTTALSATPPSPSIYGQTVTLTATVSGNSPAGTMQFRENGASLTCNGGNPVLDAGGQASCVLTGLNAGSYSFSADYPGDGNNTASSSNVLTHVVNKADQVITGFAANPATGAVGGSATLSATASSGLVVSFASGTPAVCTVTGSTVAFLSAGNCVLTADQGGNANYNPAPQVVLNIGVSVDVATAASVPTMSAWALALLGLLMLVGANIERRPG